VADRVEKLTRWRCPDCGKGQIAPEEVLHLRALETRAERYRAALELIAVEKRPDGTHNRDREACGQLAREALEGNDHV